MKETIGKLFLVCFLHWCFKKTKAEVLELPRRQNVRSIGICYSWKTTSMMVDTVQA